MDRNKLRQELLARVNNEELKTLCFNLNVDYDDLAGDERQGKARELVQLLERNNRLPDLEAELTAFGMAGAGVPEALRPYLKVVARRNNTLPLAPLDPKGQDATTISLGQIFINLDAGQKEVANNAGHPYLYSAALAHIHKNRQMILLGDPGSGKSTLLRFLTHCLAQQKLAPDEAWHTHLHWTETEKTADRKKRKTVARHWTGATPYPILLDLRDFATTNFDPHSPTALWHFIAQRLQRDGFASAVAPLQVAAQKGRVILLLDGVDEVPLAKRPAVWQAISALDKGPYGENRWLATCRILSFVPNEAPKNIPVQTVQPLNEAQIKQFITQWYAVLVETGELSHTQGETMVAQLHTAAQNRLHPLAVNPMLLTIMALVQTYHGTLPDERARLYQACVETLLLRWQRHKETDSDIELPDVLAQLGTTQQTLERLLWEIAWKAHSRAAEREEAADIAETEILQIAKAHLGSFAQAEQFILYTERRAHLLIGYGGQNKRVYRFPHRTFQEYLAACFVASQRNYSRGVAPLAERGDAWREVLNLTTGTLVFNQNNVEKALDGIERLLPNEVPALENNKGWQRVWFAGEMMVVVGKEVALRDRVGRKILPRLCKLLALLVSRGQLTVQQRAEAGQALALLGDPRRGVGVIERDGGVVPDILWGKEVPAGTYTIGGDADAGEPDERRVAIKEPFRLAAYPITNQQFQCFVDASDCDQPEWWQGLPDEEKKFSEPRFAYDNHPREIVSYYQAVAFCRWLRAQLGMEIRLPHEVEWEVAARYPDGFVYPWGNEFNREKANTYEGGVGQTTAVGSYPMGKNEALNLYDLSGNVWEWCANKYKTPDEDQVGRSNDLRVLRGGSWSRSDSLARAAYRYNDSPGFRYSSLGFRVVVVRRSPSYQEH